MRAPILLALLALSCTRPARPATDKDLLALQQSLAVAESRSSTDLDVSEILVQTLSEIDLGRTEKCRDWLGTVLVTRDHARRTEAVKRAAAECHFPCAPNGFEGQTSAAIAKDCNSSDPLLPAITVAKRDALTPVTYVWLRGLVEQTRIGLSQNPDEKARTLEKQLEKQLPRALSASIWK